MNWQNKMALKLGSTNKTTVLTNLLLLGVVYSSFAQISDCFYLSEHLRKGVLANGFSYYVVRNEHASDKIEFRFVDKAGLLAEEGKERGISHLIEHLGMRSTRNFPSGLTPFFQSQGLVYGQDISASTSIATNYELTIPANDAALLDKAFSAVNDWANGMKFLPNEVEEEQAAVINELSHGQDSAFQAYITSPYLLFNRHPMYARTTDSVDLVNVKTANAKFLESFYEKWYTPDQQAIIVVGNIDPREIERRIISQFSNLTSTKPNRINLQEVRNKYHVTLTGENKVVVVNHGNRDQSMSVRIYRTKGKVQVEDRVQQSIVDQLFNYLLRNRFDQVLLNREGMQIVSVIDRNSIHGLAGVDAWLTDIRLDRIEKLMPAIESVVQELYRIDRWGFSQQEFVKATENTKASLQGRCDPTSASIANELAGYFIDSIDLTPSVTYNELIDKIDLRYINNFSADWAGFEKNVDVLISLPSETLVKRISRQDIIPRIKAIGNQDIQPIKTLASKILPDPVLDKTVKYDRKECDPTTMLFSLSNGVKVYVKRLGSKPQNKESWNELAIIGFSNSHPRKLSKAEERVAKACAAIVSRSGLPNLDSDALSIWKQERNRNGTLELAPYIEGKEVGFQGGCSLTNFSNLLKMIFYYRTEPRIDKAAIEFWKCEAEKNNLQYKTAAKVIDDSVKSVFYGMSKPDKIIHGKYSSALVVFNQYFRNTDDFTFIVAGYFEMDDVIPLIVKYLGNLPKSSANMVHHQAKTQMNREFINARPSLGKRISFYRDSTGTTQVRLVLPLLSKKDPQQKATLQIANEIINQALFKRLREKEKGVYSITCSLAENNDFFSFDVAFECLPENVDRLIDAAVDEMTSSLVNRIDELTFNTAKNAIQKRHQNSSIYSHFCAGILLAQVREGIICPDIDLANRLIEKVKLIDVRECLMLIRPTDYTAFTLY